MRVCCGSMVVGLVLALHPHPHIYARAGAGRTRHTEGGSIGGLLWWLRAIVRGACEARRGRVDISSVLSCNLPSSSLHSTHSVLPLQSTLGSAAAGCVRLLTYFALSHCLLILTLCLHTTYTSWSPLHPLRCTKAFSKTPKPSA